jgi:hypothetical protein
LFFIKKKIQDFQSLIKGPAKEFDVYKTLHLFRAFGTVIDANKGVRTDNVRQIRA